MKLKVKTNFGAINGRRWITFKSEDQGKWSTKATHKSFLRWKRARKAWRSRKGKQLLMPL